MKKLKKFLAVWEYKTLKPEQKSFYLPIYKNYKQTFTYTEYYGEYINGGLYERHVKTKGIGKPYKYQRYTIEDLIPEKWSDINFKIDEK